MKPFLPFLLLFILTLGFLVTSIRRAGKRPLERGRDWPFAHKKPLTPVEQTLHRRLVDALPEFVVLAQVPLTAFLQVRKGHDHRAWHNRISQKSIDYLVCERDFSVVMAVELDDASHDGATGKKRDGVKNRALTAAGVTLVRWRTSALPDVSVIRSIVDDLRHRDFAGQDVVTAARIEPRRHVSVIDASNDASIWQEETRS